MAERFVVRDNTALDWWEWLPDWLVVDTQKEVRVAAYDDERSARDDAEARNAEKAASDG